MKYITRYEVKQPLGNGGATVASFKTLKEARDYRATKDLNIFKTTYGVSAGGKKLRFNSEFVY